MIEIRAKEGLEDVYASANAKLEGIEAAETEETEREIARIRAEIAAKYAEQKKTLATVLDALSEPYEVEDAPVEEQEEEPTSTADPNLSYL